MFVNMNSLYDVCLLSIMKGFDGSLTLESILVMREHSIVCSMISRWLGLWEMKGKKVILMRNGRVVDLMEG